MKKTLLGPAPDMILWWNFPFWKTEVKDKFQTVSFPHPPVKGCSKNRKTNQIRKSKLLSKSDPGNHKHLNCIIICGVGSPGLLKHVNIWQKVMVTCVIKRYKDVFKGKGQTNGVLGSLCVGSNQTLEESAWLLYLCCPGVSYFLIQADVQVIARLICQEEADGNCFSSCCQANVDFQFCLEDAQFPQPTSIAHYHAPHRFFNLTQLQYQV